MRPGEAPAAGLGVGAEEEAVLGVGEELEGGGEQPAHLIIIVLAVIITTIIIIVVVVVVVVVEVVVVQYLASVGPGASSRRTA